jgi:hypothetical protein
MSISRSDGTAEDISSERPPKPCDEFWWRMLAESAVEYVAKSEGHNPTDFSHALNLAVLALAQQELGHPDEAAAALAEASQLIIRLKETPNNKIHPGLLIAEILLREAETKTSGSDESKPSERKVTSSDEPAESLKQESSRIEGRHPP